ncbi:hypothetical protein [Desulfomonile tiedjei]|uniref:Uncharacterized protein n=1 Tax=Desulfomonile tiedjei (strain ATCC 49306 / DSM 6799 / DCB-1) TaxID=706587 RepID=I4CDT1_DESTA|nr:hypothetical protein [Desulfomonile tiedjei]AFM27722.1 hypothetical protein Desti_5115 [Desulfomonile tiedjei DSM 6799]
MNDTKETYLTFETVDQLLEVMDITEEDLTTLSEQGKDLIAETETKERD